MAKRTASTRKKTRTGNKPKAATTGSKSASKAGTGASKPSGKKASKKVSKKTTKKTAKVAKKPVSKKTPASGSKAKASAKSGSKAPPKAKASSKPAAKAPKKSSNSKAPAKPKPVAPEAAPPPPPVEAAAPEAPVQQPAPAEKTAPKPMTVSQKPSSRRAKPPAPQMPKLGEPLFRPGAPAPKPLIASGPKAMPAALPTEHGGGKPIKSPLDKKQLEQFRQILLLKRAELVGDVATMENEALMSQSGALSHLPQHMAEQGSDVYGQSLSLDLAAADRRLIKEIDDALLRIQEGTYGVCELTGTPIKLERLRELPWARYSIEAAREIERRGATQ